MSQSSTTLRNLAGLHSRDTTSLHKSCRFTHTSLSEAGGLSLHAFNLDSSDVSYDCDLLVASHELHH
jgi:hypothetical protein